MKGQEKYGMIIREQRAVEDAVIDYGAIQEEERLLMEAEEVR